MLNRRQFVWSFVSSISAAGVVLHAGRSAAGPRKPRGRASAFPPPPERIGCLYNGYFLTVDPGRALAPDPADRHRLYVLHAVLLDAATGRIAATYPVLPSVAADGDPVAHPAADYQNLQMEVPPPPNISAPDLVQYWTARGVDPSLLTGVWLVDVQGAVATPGLIDDHFHVSSWSKKLAPEGSRFGYYADIGDPAYYTDVTDWGRFCVRKALWTIVADANAFLAEESRDKIYLHGYWYTMADDLGDDGFPESFLFQESVPGAVPDPAFLLNRVGRGPTAPQVPPADPCTSDPSSWPPLDYESVPALLVHTSGQACWFNAALLEAFNAVQSDALGAFPSTAVSGVSPPDAEGDPWRIHVSGGGSQSVLAQPVPFGVDLIVPDDAGGLARYVPFLVQSVDAASSRLDAVPMLSDVAEDVLGGEVPSGMTLIPFVRPIPAFIPQGLWDAAAGFYEESPETGRLAYGHWDPRAPYRTNWYNGAERGLIQYVRDETVGVWRVSGYAEHYVMRDRLSTFVLDPNTPEEGMRQRRTLARWCHRHGITSVQDIMFYRRKAMPNDFAACEGLSYDHRYPGGMGYYTERDVDPRTETGGLNLRIGLYYYVENAAGIPEVLDLAHPAGGRTDPERLRPPEGHPEYPGWIRWAGWKLQLDGGIGARTLFSSAPMPKPAFDDPVTTTLEDGREMCFANHGFGLLTMTNVQEPVLTSRESAALYWLVRESDPASQFHNGSMTGDWTFLAAGAAGWIGRTVDGEALEADLAVLEHVDLPDPGPLAEKIVSLMEQVQSGWERTLSAMARIWYEASVRGDGPVPLPSQTVCHAAGDGGVDLYVRAIKQLRDDLRAFPSRWEDLPSWWRSVLPEDADLGAVRRTFSGERFRVEHWLNVSGTVLEDLQGGDGLDVATPPEARNVVFSTQPALLVLDGEAIRARAFPYPQEIWDIPDGGSPGLWYGISANPRYHHHMPCPLLRDRDIPFSLSSDPPAVRDPRPAITFIGAVARTPVEIDPQHWVGQEEGVEPERPIDYLVGAVYGPFGLTPSTPDNPMRLSLEQALTSMTFWAAYVANQEREVGALAPPGTLGDEQGWLGDLVIWAVNPLAIEGPDGMHLEDLATLPEGTAPVAAAQMCNAFIKKFRPSMTIVGGVPVWTGGGENARADSLEAPATRG